MRFTSILLAGAFAVFANAQATGTTTAVSQTSNAAPAQTTSAVTKCIAACKNGDVACTAACIGVSLERPQEPGPRLLSYKAFPVCTD